MLKTVAYLVVACMICSSAVPAYAGAIQKTSVSDTERGALASQQVEDAPQLAEIAAGTGADKAMTALGFVLFVVVIGGAVAMAVASGG